MSFSLLLLFLFRKFYDSINNKTDRFLLILFLWAYTHKDNKYNAGNNKHVDINFSAYDAFLEKSLSGTLKIKRLESQII